MGPRAIAALLPIVFHGEYLFNRPPRVREGAGGFLFAFFCAFGCHQMRSELPKKGADFGEMICPIVGRLPSELIDGRCGIPFA
jgi:hypothetical protein